LIAKGFLAVAIVIMAGILAIATAAAGLALATVALMMRVSGSRGEQAGASHYDENSEGGAVTLEARKTPHGWTVE